MRNKRFSFTASYSLVAEAKFMASNQRKTVEQFCREAIQKFVNESLRELADIRTGKTTAASECGEKLSLNGFEMEELVSFEKPNNEPEVE